MKICYRRLLSDIYGDVIIYGTGYYAKRVYEKFKDLGIGQNVKCFVVSNLITKKDFCGKEVYSISEYIERYAGELVLIAVSELYVVQMQNILKQHGIGNFLCLTDYMEKEEFGLEDILFKENSEDYFLSLSYKWAYENYEKLFYDQQSLYSYLNERERIRNRKQVVFLVGLENAMPRTTKIMGALKRKGYDIVLLTYANVEGIRVIEELEELEILVERCDSLGEIMYKMLVYNPLIYYIEPIWGDCSWADILIKLKRIWGKVVITLYDVFNDGLMFATNEQKQLERYALENADGIVWRTFAEEDLKKEMNLVSKTIQFLDYCDASEDIQIEENFSEKTEEIKLAYVIGAVDYLFALDGEDNKFTRLAGVREILGKLGDDNQCKIHFFCIGDNQEIMAQCKQIESQYSNVKFIWNVYHKELVRCLKNYDYGTLIYTGGQDTPYDVEAYGMTGRGLRNATVNKYFDYLQAGIPIVTHGGNHKLIELINQYEVVVKMDLMNWDNNVLREKVGIYKENAKRAKQAFSIDNQIGKLISFFENVGE